MTELLAIETSSEACSVALHGEHGVKTFFEHAPMGHADLLLPAIKSLLDESGLRLESLDAIAFGRGPGSFTSLRIGIGVVQGLAWGAGLPVVPISSLAAVAQDAADGSGSEFSAVCVATDARMQEVYTANYNLGEDGIVVLSGEERVCEPAGVAAPGPEAFIAAGNGFERFRELETLASLALECKPQLQPRAETICRLALDWLSRNEALPAHMAQPVYVRNDIATKPGQG